MTSGSAISLVFALFLWLFSGWASRHVWAHLFCVRSHPIMYCTCKFHWGLMVLCFLFGPIGAFLGGLVSAKMQDDDNAALTMQQPMSNERIGIIAIHYTEGHPETYKRVTLSIGDDEFSWYTPPQMAYDAALEMAEAYGAKVAHSSTIDNYKMDGGLLLA